jgi:outer membrane lipopolysaccharide assembly protein LptE/RlpB
MVSLGGLPDGDGEYIMKNRIIVSLLGIVLLALVTMSTGCGFFDQQGKTAEEVNRDHIRMLRVNNEQMMEDIDRTLLLDKPSKLTEKQLP